MGFNTSSVPSLMAVYLCMPLLHPFLPPLPTLSPSNIPVYHLILPLQIAAFMSVLESTNSLLTAYANATSYIPTPVYVTGFTSTSACPSGDTASTSQTSGQGNPSALHASLDYDNGLFSFVGCRCDAEYDNMYAVDDQGGQALKPQHWMANIMICINACVNSTAREQSINSFALDLPHLSIKAAPTLHQSASSLQQVCIRSA